MCDFSWFLYRNISDIIGEDAPPLLLMITATQTSVGMCGKSGIYCEDVPPLLAMKTATQTSVGMRWKSGFCVVNEEKMEVRDL